MAGRLLTAAIVLVALTMPPLPSGATSPEAAYARAGSEGDAFFGTITISASGHEHTDTEDGATDERAAMNETTTFSGVLGHFGAELKGLSTAGSYHTEDSWRSQKAPGDSCDITLYTEHYVSDTTITGFSGRGLLSFDHEVPAYGGSDRYLISAPDNSSTTVETLDSHAEWAGGPGTSCPPPEDDHESKTTTGRGDSFFDLRSLSLRGTWNTRTSPGEIHKTVHFHKLGMDHLSGTVTWDLSFRCAGHPASRTTHASCRSLRLRTSTLETDLLGTVRLTAVRQPPGSSRSGYVFEWRRAPGSGDGRSWTRIHSGSSRSFTFRPKIAGNFQLRVREGSRGGGGLQSDPVSLTVRFPDVATIIQDPQVNEVDQAFWKLGADEWTLAEDHLNERCFWWGLDTRTGQYVTSPVVTTPSTPAGTDECQLPDRPGDEPSALPPLTSEPVWWVAWFHTHPTRQGREVGPSPRDRLRTCQEGAPGILIDFVESAPGPYGATQVYPIGPPARRYLPGTVTLPCAARSSPGSSSESIRVRRALRPR